MEQQILHKFWKRDSKCQASKAFFFVYIVASDQEVTRMLVCEHERPVQTQTHVHICVYINVYIYTYIYTFICIHADLSCDILPDASATLSS